MHTVLALLCFVVVIHWLIYPYPSGFLHWHCGNLKIVPVPVKQPWWIWVNSSYELDMNDYITTTKQSTTKPCAYLLGYTVWVPSFARRRLTHHSWKTKRFSPFTSSMLLNLVAKINFAHYYISLYISSCGYIIIIIVDSCMIWFDFDCIIQ